MFVYTILSTKFNVLVEDGVVISPCTIRLFDGLDHRVKEVVSLLAPRFVEHDGTHCALSGTTQSCKIWAQGLNVLVTPTFHLVVTAYGIRLLPKVEMELLILYFGQLMIVYTYVEGKRSDYLSLLVNDF